MFFGVMSLIQIKISENHKKKLGELKYLFLALHVFFSWFLTHIKKSYIRKILTQQK